MDTSQSPHGPLLTEAREVFAGHRRRKARHPDLDRTIRRYFVYRLYDSADTCIYIGRSYDVPARLRVHVANTTWATDVRTLDMTGPFTWDEAVREERAWITRYQPIHNQVGTERWAKERYPKSYGIR